MKSFALAAVFLLAGLTPSNAQVAPGGAAGHGTAYSVTHRAFPTLDDYRPYADMTGGDTARQYNADLGSASGCIALAKAYDASISIPGVVEATANGFVSNLPGGAISMVVPAIGAATSFGGAVVGGLGVVTNEDKAMVDNCMIYRGHRILNRHQF